MNSKPAIVFGTGSFASLAAFYLDNDSRYRVVAFTVHAAKLTDTEFERRPVIPWEDVPDRYPAGEFDLFVAVGYTRMNRIRQTLCEEARARGYRLLSYVCSKSITWPGLAIGDNSFVFENNTIQPFATVGNGTVLWSGNHIGHHSHIGNYCFISSHVVVSGHCVIGDRCFLGVNATVADGVRVADECLIGPASLIQKDTQLAQAYFSERTAPFPRSSSRFFR